MLTAAAPGDADLLGDRARRGVALTLAGDEPVGDGLAGVGLTADGPATDGVATEGPVAAVVTATTGAPTDGGADREPPHPARATRTTGTTSKGVTETSGRTGTWPGYVPPMPYPGATDRRPREGLPVKLSILMPVYNERATLVDAVRRVLAVDYGCEVELVIVDDGSTDGTRELYPEISASDSRVVVHQADRNRGKGAAIKAAAGLAGGDYLIICDADLEYRPEEIPSLLEPVHLGDAVVVYGSRSFTSNNAFSYWYVLGNRGVTLAANLMFNCYISDLETCFKLMPVELYRSLQVDSAGFGMEAEITGKLLRRGVRIYEVPISYASRSREEGKKLTWKDGVEALWILARERGRRA